MQIGHSALSSSGCKIESGRSATGSLVVLYYKMIVVLNSFVCSYFSEMKHADAQQDR
jgi:hypothetical protein